MRIPAWAPHKPTPHDARYFVFKDGVLSYFKKPGADSRGELELTADTTVTLSESKTNCFELVSGRAGLYAHAETDADCKAWVAALKAHVDSLQAGGGKGGGGGGGAGGGSSGVKMHSFAVSGTRFHIPEQYELIKPIGQGAYGVVISANDTESGEKIAIKKITRAFEDLIDAKRILREIRLLKHFDHENIISIVSLIRPPSVRFEDIYIVSELMDTDLHRVIYSRQKLSDDHIQYFLYQLLRAMKYLHSANVLHRDLKPSNLLVNSNCDLKVCDFGLARGIISQDEGNAELTEYVVTRWYRAPEIMLACREYTRAVDVWSVGCILGELLGRKPLFPGNDYIHQLQIIADTVGSPPTEELHFITSEKAMRFMKSQPRKKKVPFSTICGAGSSTWRRWSRSSSG